MTAEALHTTVKQQKQETGSKGLVSRLNLISRAVILIIFALGVLLRWTGLSTQSLWADEGYTTWFSQLSPAAQWHLMPWETQAPIYHVLLHYWTALWGMSVTSFRSLSALFSSLSLGVVYLIARKMWPSSSFAILGTGLCAVSFFQVWYAKEARSYALLLFFLLTSVYCMQRYLENSNWKHFLALIVAVSAGLYTHNMAVYYLPGLVLFGFIYPSELGPKARARNLGVAAASVIVCYIPWLPLLVKQARSVHGYFWAPKPTFSNLADTLSSFCGIDAWVLSRARNYIHVPRLLGVRSWLALIPIILTLCIVSTLRAKLTEDRRKSMALQVYTLFPVALVFLWSRISTSVYVNRNLIGACALIPLVICAPTAVYSGAKKKLFEIVACFMLCAAIVSLSLHQQSKDDWRGLTRYMLNLPERQRVIFVFQPYCQIIVHYYATAWAKAYPHEPEIRGLVTDFNVVPTGPGILPKLQTADLISILGNAFKSEQYKEIDIALQAERLPPNVQAIPGYLKGHCASVVNEQFGNLAVERCFILSK